MTVLLELYAAFLLLLLGGAAIWPRLRWPLLTVFTLALLVPVGLLILLLLMMRGSDVHMG